MATVTVKHPSGRLLTINEGDLSVYTAKGYVVDSPEPVASKPKLKVRATTRKREE